MPILVGIDGTGSELVPGEGRDKAYDVAFANSFVKRICRQSTTTKYFRGPVALGGGMNDAIVGAVSFIKDLHKRMPNEPILLTGYSRGAAAVVIVARKLKEANIPVRALLMFDCVDRYLFDDAAVIPNNVEFVRHVIRDPAGRSRRSFGNDGTKYNPPTNYETITMYMCTHGGMGGTPWKKPNDKKGTDFIDEGALEAWIAPGRREPVWTYKTYITYDQDVIGSKQVWAGVQNFLKTHKFYT
jgi:hypothetical protein